MTSDIHPDSLRGMIEAAGGTYLTGGGAALTSFALARFVVAIAEHTHAAAPPARQPQPLTDEQRAVLLFLLGYETLHGLGFGERHPSRPGAFWWRGELDAAFPGLHVGKPMGGIGREGE